MKENDISTNELEEGKKLRLDFTKIDKIGAGKKGVIPVAVQDAGTKEVILIAYTDKEALEKTVETRIATFRSTSRDELWIKGATSGNTYEVKEIYVNCEQNSLVYLVKAKKDGICHTFNSKGKPRNCYYRRLNFTTGELENLDP